MNKKILTDICGEIQQAIGESPMKYKVIYDERLQAYKVTEQGNEDSVSFFFSYEKAIKFIAVQVLKNAAFKVDLSR